MTPGHYDYVPLERVSWGVPAAEAVAREAARLGATRVFVVASRTLARTTDVVTGIQAALGARFAGLFDQCKEHTPIDSVLTCVAAAHAARPDLIVSAGGGSVIDTVKVVQLCLTHGIETTDALLALAGKVQPKPSVLRQLAVPTTLSGGEYSSAAGATDPARKMKDSYLAPDLCPRVVVLDPAATLHTPEWLWLSTAIRALDHAGEGYCAALSNPLVQGQALHAMRLFAASLRQTKRDPGDLDARLQAQMAVWLAAGSLGRVPMGASHGIGYLLGTFAGVPHGYTSCVMLPAVLRWNEPATSAQQADIAAALGMPGAPAAEAVGALIADLGLPRTLSDVNVPPEMLPKIAEAGARHPVVRGNPRPITRTEDVMEILQLAQ